ncbi:MAG: glycoside hydrolase family 3 protein [Lachnospiraceae bacterium]
MAESTEMIEKEIEEREAQEKREARRKRRQTNQALAYMTLLLLVMLVAVAVVFLIHFIKNNKPVSEKPQSSVDQSAIGDMIGEEEELTIPEETEMVVELTPEQKLDAIIDEAVISVMPLEDKVAGLFIVTPESITGVDIAIKAGDGTKEALNKWAVGGVIYFDQNIKSEEQFKEMVSNTALYSRYPIFTCMDEEGGKVSRLAKKDLVDNVGSAGSIGETGDAANALAAGKYVSAYMMEYGLNVNFAPVADIRNAEGSYIGERAYSSDATVTAAMVSASVTGLKENKVSACLKHFPGIGSSTEDTHVGLAISERTLEEFRAEEFTVFKAGIDAGADFVMVSHMSAPALTGDNTPCSLSPAVVTDYLRGELGFDGVIITDAMNMGAITEYKEADEAAILALKAGCDMILMPDDYEKAYNGVLQAVKDGTISEERINDSLRRIYRIKYADKLPE